MIHHTITLQAGTTVDFRPIQPHDTELLMAMHHRASQASLASRYFRPYLPTLQEIAEICELDCRRGVAYVATINREIVGLGYYLIDGRVTTTAETAFLVQDDFQRRGIGRTLLQLLAQHALSQQVVAFDAYVQAGNEPMMRILRSAGFALKAHVSYGTFEVHLDLTASPLSPVRSN
ncbi:MAG: GNAT family N-acetyltransferase [Caldilineaceae bacterium]|nr:GNAT family N-acetyltransferase [Caldilineaceae bacterium]